MTDLPHPRLGGAFSSPVTPGSGWPGDPAEPGTPVARTPAGVRRLAARADPTALDARISVCSACPRLVRWREQVARTKRASYAGEPYWGRPVPGFGVPDPRILVVGLAPAANGANRTGRVFTGDRSGDWLYAGLHRAGLATQATSVDAADGLTLVGTRVLAAVRCAPPDNKPTPQERATCAPWAEAELAHVAPGLRVVLALGTIGWDAALRALATGGWQVPRPRPRFGHGAQVELSPTDNGPSVVLVGCYHPSQQNTFTRRLTEPMLDDVLSTAARLAGLPD